MKKAAIVIGVVLVAVCGFGAISFQQRSAAAKKPDSKGTTATVEKGRIAVTVVETGKVDANQVVEVKSQVTGRLAQLFVDEGDFVKKGQLIGIIDPQETKLRVEQNQAQLRGAQTAVDRAALEIEQRKLSAKAAYEQSLAQVRQLELELKTQPILSRAAIREAETALATAQQERQRMVQSVQPTQRTNAQSSVAEAEANYTNAKREFDRQQDLAKQGYVSGRAEDTARLSLDLARVRLEQAKDNLARLETQLRSDLSKQDEVVAQAQAALTRAKANQVQDKLKFQALASARAQSESARAALQDPAILSKQREQSMATVAQLSSALSDSERQLGETEIRSPIDGIVTKKGINVGEMATGLSTFGSGSTIVTLEDRKSMRVKLEMNEIDVAKLTNGMDAKVEVDALPDTPFTGKVKKIAPASIAAAAGATDPVVRYQVEIYLDQAPPELRSGMTAKCSMDVLAHDDVMVVPNEFIGKDGKVAFVSVAPEKPTDKPKRVDIKIGATSGSKTEIESGVTVGTKLVRPEYKGPARKGAMQIGGDDE